MHGEKIKRKKSEYQKPYPGATETCFTKLLYSEERKNGT